MKNFITANLLFIYKYIFVKLVTNYWNRIIIQLIVAILFQLLLNKNIAFCDIWDWNPGKFLINEPSLSESLPNESTPIEYPEIIVSIARLCLADVISTGDPSQAQVPEPQAQVPEPQAQVPEPQAQVPEPQAQVPEPQAQVPYLTEKGKINSLDSSSTSSTVRSIKKTIVVSVIVIAVVKIMEKVIT